MLCTAFDGWFDTDINFRIFILRFIVYTLPISPIHSFALCILYFPWRIDL